MKGKPHSLRLTLTKGLIAIQAVVLIGFTLLAAVPFLVAQSAQQGLDEGVVDDIVRSVSRLDPHHFTLNPNSSLQSVMGNYPDFWFIAVDSTGALVKHGNVPEPVSLFPNNLLHVSSANFSDLGDNHSGHALVRTRNSSVGRLWVMTGGGPPVGLSIVAKAIGNPLFVGLLLLLAGATVLVIPPLIRKSLSGVEDVARDSEIIDVGNSGVRLSYERVPIEIIPLVRAFNAVLDRLHGGIARQQRFLADAAHELRTPIAILQTRLESLPDGPEKRQLQRDSARLAGMANELLDLHRMALTPDGFEPVDLVDMAAQVTADLAPLAIDAGGEIEFDAPDAPVMVKGDASALSRALANLVHNAMSHGGPRVAIRVEVSAGGSVSVSDNGPGIDPQHREEIFWPFRRLSQSPNGAGLGLSLVNDIVKRHGGRIVAMSAPEGGALFEMTLPLLKAD
jgi:signal transduction histidine kinase